MALHTTYEKFYVALPKSVTTETRLSIKGLIVKEKERHFIDLREYWFNSGPMEPPTPTSKGAMVDVDHGFDLAAGLLKGLVDGGYLSQEQKDRLTAELNR